MRRSEPVRYLRRIGEAALGHSTDFGRIVGQSRSAVAPVNIENMARNPIAFIGGKVERSVGYGVDIAVAMHRNAIEVAASPCRSVCAQSRLDWTWSDGVDHDVLP